MLRPRCATECTVSTLTKTSFHGCPQTPPPLPSLRIPVFARVLLRLWLILPKSLFLPLCSFRYWTSPFSPPTLSQEVLSWSNAPRRAVLIFDLEWSPFVGAFNYCFSLTSLSTLFPSGFSGTTTDPGPSFNNLPPFMALVLFFLFDEDSFFPPATLLVGFVFHGTCRKLIIPLWFLFPFSFRFVRCSICGSVVFQFFSARF